MTATYEMLRKISEELQKNIVRPVDGNYLFEVWYQKPKLPDNARILESRNKREGWYQGRIDVFRALGLPTINRNRRTRSEYRRLTRPKKITLQSIQSMAAELESHCAPVKEGADGSYWVIVHSDPAVDWEKALAPIEK